MVDKKEIGASHQKTIPSVLKKFYKEVYDMQSRVKLKWSIKNSGKTAFRSSAYASNFVPIFLHKSETYFISHTAFDLDPVLLKY